MSKHMRQYTIKTFPPTVTLKEMTTQPWDRALIYIAEDVRQDVQCFSHTISGLQAAIKEATSQHVPSSSLYDSCLGKLKSDRTAGAFRILRFPRDDGLAHLNATSGQYKRRVGGLIDPMAVQLI
ncbi:hypothetical protein OAO87_00340 [bacterium]|nr:hypothetical protein [bacterium]